MKSKKRLEAFKKEEFTEIYYCYNMKNGLKVVFCGENNYVAKYSRLGSGVYKIRGDVKKHLKRNYLEYTKETDKKVIQQEVEFIIDEIEAEFDFFELLKFGE